MLFNNCFVQGCRLSWLLAVARAPKARLAVLALGCFVSWLLPYQGSVLALGCRLSKDDPSTRVSACWSASNNVILIKQTLWLFRHFGFFLKVLVFSFKFPQECTLLCRLGPEIFVGAAWFFHQYFYLCKMLSKKVFHFLGNETHASNSFMYSWKCQKQMWFELLYKWLNRIWDIFAPQILWAGNTRQ